MATRTALTLAALAALAAPLDAQEYPRPEDVATPEAAILAAYASLARPPGEKYDWERFRSLHLPSAVLVPNTEQTGGTSRVLTVQGFIDWIGQPDGGDGDRGFAEEQVHIDLDTYGDIAQAMSTYQKHFWEDERILGRGINSFNLVRIDGRWWIASIAWDEENGAGSIPHEYLP